MCLKEVFGSFEGVAPPRTPRAIRALPTEPNRSHPDRSTQPRVLPHTLTLSIVKSELSGATVVAGMREYHQRRMQSPMQTQDYIYSDRFPRLGYTVHKTYRRNATRLRVWLRRAQRRLADRVRRYNDIWQEILINYVGGVSAPDRRRLLYMPQ